MHCSEQCSSHRTPRGCISNTVWWLMQLRVGCMVELRMCTVGTSRGVCDMGCGGSLLALQRAQHARQQVCERCIWSQCMAHVRVLQRCAMPA